jgi:hypothetical protein
MIKHYYPTTFLRLIETNRSYYKYCVILKYKTFLRCLNGLGQYTGIYIYIGISVLLIVVGIIFFLFYDPYETSCQTAEISGFKLPVCGKGPFLIVAGIVVLVLTKVQAPDLSTKKNIQEGSVTNVATRAGIEGQ